jgi:hypothetical protein
VSGILLLLVENTTLSRGPQWHNSAPQFTLTFS